MDNKITKKEEGTVNKGGLVIAIIILIGLCIGGYFLTRYIIDFFADKDSEVTNNEKQSHDNLLDILNNEASKSAISGEQKAYKLLTFDYKNDDHFYISGINDNTIFNYDIDLSTTESVNNIDSAYRFITNNSLSSYATSITRYTIIDSNELVNKYPSSNVKAGNLVTNTKVFGTIYKNNNINIINGDNLSSVLDNSYSPKTLDSSSSLFKLYKYIANN